jgi:Zn-dependent protease with chaperone function
MKNTIITFLVMIALYSIIQYVNNNTIIKSPVKNTPVDNRPVFISNDVMVQSAIETLALENIPVYIVTNKTDSAYTYGKDITINTKFFDMLTPYEQVMVLFHEYGHIYYNHNNKFTVSRQRTYNECIENYTREKCIKDLDSDMSLLYESRMHEYEADMVSYKLAKKAGVDNTACNMFIKFDDGKDVDDIDNDHPLLSYRYEICMSVL